MIAKPTIGVVTISYNEERDLPGFLEHLLPWVDEIVIVDDGSTDRTAQLAAAAGSKVKFIVSPRQPGEYYSLQRNKGIAAATADWLLHMDIDERVTPELRDELLNVMPDSEMDAYNYNRLNFFLHRPIRHGNWAYYKSLRFARRDRFHFGGKIHEISIIERDQPQIGRLHGAMWHFNEPTYELRLKKSVRYAAVDSEILLEKKKRIGLGHILFVPLAFFVLNYIVRGGFLDGIAGFILGIQTYIGKFNTYVLAWDEQNRLPREAMEDQFAELSRKQAATEARPGAETV